MANPWIIRHCPRPSASLRLFCFHYAGIGASAFRSWGPEIDPDIEVCCVQLPGRESRHRETPYGSFDELAPVVADGIAPELGCAFAFYGHSMGAKVAFETARVLRANGQAQPFHFFAGASAAPHLPWRHPRTHDLPEAEFIEAIQQRYGGVPRPIIEDPEMRALLLPTLRADMRMVETCRSAQQASLQCPITAFGGLDDRTVSQSEIESWRQQTTAEFKLYMLDGDHFFLQSARKGMLNVIATALKETETGATLRKSLLEPGPRDSWISD